MKRVADIKSSLQSRPSFFYWFVAGLSTSVILLFSFLGYSFIQTEQLHADITEIDYSYKLINQIKETVQTLYASESTVRGYVISHDKTFLTDYPMLKDSIDRQLKDLHQLTQNGKYEKQLHQFHRMISERISMMDTTILYVNGSIVYPSEQVRLSRIQHARVLMKHIHAIEVRIQNTQEISLNKQNKHSRLTIIQSQEIVFLSAFAGLLIAIQIGVIVLKYFQKQNQAANHLKELNEQKNRFFSIISHDLRGPVHSANMLLQVIRTQDHLPTNDRNRLLDGAIETITQSTRLLDNLLTWGRSQLNHLNFEPQQLNVKFSVDEIIEIMSPVAFQKGIVLTNQASTEAQVYADAEMLGMVLRNLISNAIKFTLPEGEVRISTRQVSHLTEIQISDTGIGMPTEVIQQLFQIDNKHSSIGTKGERGTGLGLILCQEYIQKNSGQIEVLSELGKGSTFFIKLPTHNN